MLENLRVTDIAVHEVFQRGPDRAARSAAHAAALEDLSQDAQDAFTLRVTTALSPSSKALEMKILKFGSDRLHGIARELVAAETPEDFLRLSGIVADKLVEAQTSQRIPGGIVVVFRGVSGRDDNKVLGVIKAEVQDGFMRHQADGTIITEFVRDLFLTKATRLYKIGLFLCPAGHLSRDEAWRCLVYDHQIAANNRELAAAYFYEVFLGCGFLEDAAYETARFFNLTREFASKKIADREVRHDVVDALFPYLKTEKAETFTVEEFTERFMPEELQDEFQQFMRAKSFPERAIRRDTENLRGRLRRRRFKYEGNIELSAPPEAFNEGRAKIDFVPNDRSGDDEPEKITVVTIRGKFIGET
ncbi:nucleoid-associated protein [Rhodobacter capsulatus]|uniref:nucleoid-associated protein n=1 Tax=Rhodobacter capsulatus TaxID=1061 RepID=UPI004028660F